MRCVLMLWGKYMLVFLIPWSPYHPSPRPTHSLSSLLLTFSSPRLPPLLGLLPIPLLLSSTPPRPSPRLIQPPRPFPSPPIELKCQYRGFPSKCKWGFTYIYIASGIWGVKKRNSVSFFNLFIFPSPLPLFPPPLDMWRPVLSCKCGYILVHPINPTLWCLLLPYTCLHSSVLSGRSWPSTRRRWEGEEGKAAARKGFYKRLEYTWFGYIKKYLG